MTTIKRSLTILAPVVGAALAAQVAVAGPGCAHGGMAKQGYQQKHGYSQPYMQYRQPAVYRQDQAGYGKARAYRAGANYGYNKPGYDKPAAAATPDIVDTAVSAGDFNTLVTAVKAAGLVDTLKGTGPFTVFAPTDEAFAKIPQEQLEALLSDKEALTRVLTYHVVPGKLEAADVVGKMKITTVEGSALSVKAGDAVMIDNARVVKTDIGTSNGVIHVIDTVILPPDMVSQR